ncbi:MAG: thermitase [Candidatus Sericytochromatia bacterium]|nr:MAG: thermitase [Candidatus Sericytochromatia bacterium]
MLKKSISIISLLFLLSCQSTINIKNDLEIKGLIRLKNSIDNNKISDLGIKNFKILSKELNIAEFTCNSKDIEKIQNSPLVKYVDIDKKMYLENFKVSNVDNGFQPNDTFFGLQWNIKNINVNKAWNITKGSPNIIVAIIDSGVDPNHPDLKDNLLPLIDVWSESGESDIYTSGSLKVNYGGRDGNGHGTHIAGIVAAHINNSSGISGIANVKILPIKSTNHMGETSASIITKSILKAIEKKANVINISIGGEKQEGTQALLDAVNLALSKNIVFVSATGNESNRDAKLIKDITVPAAYPGVIAVGASTKSNRVANYSNGGKEIDVLAPGGESNSKDLKIYSTWPTYITYEGYRSGVRGPYAALSGTSMASPHVAGIAALLLSNEPNLTPQQVRLRILSTAKDVEAIGYDTASGYGIVDAYKMLLSNKHSN